MTHDKYFCPACSSTACKCSAMLLDEKGQPLPPPSSNTYYIPIATMIQLTDIPLTWLDLAVFNNVNGLLSAGFLDNATRAAELAAHAYDLAEAMLAEKKKREAK